jgi:hypothetical protein
MGGTFGPGRPPRPEEPRSHPPEGRSSESPPGSKKNLVKTRRRKRFVIDPHGLPVEFAFQLRNEVKVTRPHLTPDQLDVILKEVSVSVPKWVFEQAEPPSDL